MNTRQMDESYVAHTYARYDVEFTRGKGALLYDETGREYVDMGSGIAVSVLGHGDDEWVKAVSRQAGELAHASNLYHTRPQAELAKALCERSGMSRVFFGNSGAEANECAIKVARKYASDRYGEGARPVVITLRGSFHGRTLATLSATGQEVFHRHFGPFPEGFAYAQPNDIADMMRVLSQHSACAVLIETIQGEGGVKELDGNYMRAVEKLIKSRDGLFMVDEVQTGSGRTGKLFSYQHFGLAPDVVTTAKGLSGGLPMGACLLGERVRDTLTPSSHGSTFGGNPVCAAGALCVLNRLTDELLSGAIEKGEYIRGELSGLKQVKSISGRGLMLGVSTEREPAELSRALLKRGVVALTAKDRLRLLPPLTITEDELKRAVNEIKQELMRSDI